MGQALSDCFRVWTRQCGFMPWFHSAYVFSSRSFSGLPCSSAYTERQLRYLHDIHGASHTALSIPGHGIAAHMRCVAPEFWRMRPGPSCDLTTVIKPLYSSHSTCEKVVVSRRPPQIFWDRHIRYLVSSIGTISGATRVMVPLPNGAFDSGFTSFLGK